MNTASAPDNSQPILVSGRLYLELAVDEQSRRHDGQAWWHHAGDGGHLATAAVRLGAAVSLFTQIGPTSHDDELLANLAGEGIDVGSVIRRGTDLANTKVLAERHGLHQPVALSSPAHCTLVADDVDAADHLLMNSRWLLADAALPIDFIDALLERASRYGLSTVLCAKKPMADRIPRRTWKHVDYLVAGVSSIEAMARQGNWPADAPSDPLQVCRMLPSLRGVVILQGAETMRVADVRDAFDMPLCPRDVVHVRGVCATAAAALAVGLAEHRPFFDAVRFVHAAVRFYVTHEGTRAAMPLRKELDAVSA